MKKRIASLLLALLMAFTLLPVQALAEEIDAADPPRGGAGGDAGGGRIPRCGRDPAADSGDRLRRGLYR